MKADLIVTGASALTMNPDAPAAAAVALAGGRIVAVGGDADILALAGPSTRHVDAKGATLLPGFVESHMHLFGGGAALKHLNVSGLKGFAAICKAVRAYASVDPDAKVLYVRASITTCSTARRSTAMFWIAWSMIARSPLSPSIFTPCGPTRYGYEAAQKANGARDARHRVEHVELIQESDIPRFKELGAIASMQPPHPPGAMDFPVEPGKTRIGPYRWHLAYAWRRMIDAGAHVPFASDWPVARVDVLAGIHAALTWEPWEPHLPGQTVTLHEALAGYTIEGAYAEHAEDRKGMLKEGYLADLVLLSGNIETCPVSDIPKLRPAMTICGGEVTHAV